MEENKEINPCKVCGSPGELVYCKIMIPRERWWIVACTSCPKEDFAPREKPKTQAAAIKKWNSKLEAKLVGKY